MTIEEVAAEDYTILNNRKASRFLLYFCGKYMKRRTEHRHIWKRSREKMKIFTGETANSASSKQAVNGGIQKLQGSMGNGPRFILRSYYTQ